MPERVAPIHGPAGELRDDGPEMRLALLAFWLGDLVDVRGEGKVGVGDPEELAEERLGVLQKAPVEAGVSH